MHFRTGNIRRFYSSIPRLILILCFGSTLLQAEEGRLILKRFGQRETGGIEICFTGSQDERGVLYFGAEVVYRYDGERWERHEVPGSQAVRALAIDQNGRLWVAAVNEIGYFERTPSGGLGTYISLVPRLPAGTPDLGDVWNVYIRDHGAIFVTSDSVLIWDGQTFRISAMPGARRLAAFKSNGEIFVSHLPTGLWKLINDRLELFIPAASLHGAAVASIESSDGGWELVTTMGLAHYTAGRIEWFGAEASEFIRRNVLTTVCRLRTGDLLIGTANNGFAVISAKGALRRVVDSRDGLQTSAVSSIFEDRDGAQWLTSPLGVTYLSLNGGSSAFGDQEGLIDRPCDSVAESGSRILVATDGGVFGLSIYSNAQPAFQRLTELRNRYSDLVNDKGDLLASGLKGVDRIRGDRMSRVFSAKRDVLRLIPSTAEPGTYLAAVGFDLVRLSSTSSEEMRSVILAPLPDVPTTIVEDRAGTIWIGTDSRGVFYLGKGPHGAWAPLHPPSGPTRTNPGHVARLGNNMVACTENGLEIFADHPAQAIPVADAPRTPAITISNPDSGQRAWIAFESPFTDGPRIPIVGRISINANGAGQWEPFAFEGLTQIGAITRLFVDRRGILWVGGTDGLLRLEPDRLKRIFEPRPPLIRASMDPDAKLEMERNSVSFDLSAVDYGRREALRFETKLSGGNWSAPTDSNRINLAGLSDDTYEFAARVVNDVGMASTPATWRFTILPPWYRTKIAFTTWALLAMAGFFGVVRWRFAYLRRQNSRLEALVQKKTEQLEKANAAKSEFLANMSHEIRNPISGIVGLSLAIEETTLDQRQRQLVESVRSCASLLATLVDDVLDFSKIEAGKIELRPAPFNLRANLEQCATMVAEEARARGASITLSIAVELPATLIGDSARVQQIVLNYLTNALKFGEGKPITVGAAQGAFGRIRIFVRDQGPGLSATDSASLFTKFTRLEPAHANNIRGTGLGLAVCRMLATMMGGSVGVDSTPGEGSCFWAELPLSEGVAAGKPVAAPPPNAAPLRALIVEDIDYNAVAMQAVLRKLGVESDVSTDGPSALTQLQRKPYDVAFMDWNLPGMIGTEVVSRFRALEAPGRRTIIIATTAYSAEASREACLDAGMDAFIAKPVTPEKIAAALQDLRGSLRAAASVEVHRSADTSPQLPGVDLQLLHFLGDELPGGISGQIDRYLASFNSDREAAREIIAMGDLKEIHRIAHRLVSHSSMVKYEPLVRLAGKLQATAATLRPEEREKLFDQFEKEFANLRSKLESIRTSTAPA